MSSFGRYGQLDKLAVDTQIVSQTLAAMTASTQYTGILNPHPILDAIGKDVGGFGNSSLAFTGSVFVNEVPSADKVSAVGDYYINYATGYFIVIAGASATPAATWEVNTLYMSNTVVTVTEKEYTFFISQAGTSAPTLSVLKNTLGQTVTAGRTSAGVYTLTASAAVFTNGKTIFFPEDWNNVVSVVVTSTTILTLTTTGDDVLSNSLFRVKVYS